MFCARRDKSIAGKSKNYFFISFVFIDLCIQIVNKYWLPTECKTVCWFLGVDNRIKCQPPRCINLRQWATHTHTEMWEKEQPTSQSLPLRRLNCKWGGVIKSFGKDLGSGDQLKGAHSTPWPSFGLKQGRTGKGVSWVPQGEVTDVRLRAAGTAVNVVFINSSSLAHNSFDFCKEFLLFSLHTLFLTVVW